ncbi:MAG: hypothetical protein QOE70_378 [Chthoniobacter sp.]|nr:hypothetical protein [Chthoniobacter sp.]
MIIPVAEKRAAKSRRKPLLVAVAVGAGLLLSGGALVAFSLWVENRGEGGEAGWLTSRARSAVTQPIAEAVATQVRRYVRAKMRSAWLLGGYSEQELLDRLASPTITRNERRLVAYRLASAATPRAIEALLQMLKNAPPEDRAFFAQLVGSAGGPAVKASLWPLLDDPDEKVILAAIRGLSAIGGPEVSARLAGMLADPQRSAAQRAEAALGLGDIGTAAAHQTLVQALATTRQTEISTEIVNSLGKFPFARVAGTFEHLLAAPETSGELRVVAVEALVNSTREAVPFLLGVAGRDADPEVRASSAWAISAHESGAPIGPALSELASREPEPDVRRRLYEALVRQTDAPAERLVPRVLAEKDVAARVAGFNAVGSAVGRQPASAAAASFDDQMVPELQRIAANENSLNIRMRAVFALRRAQTPSAQAALAAIAASTSESAPQVATAARNGLPARP